MKKSFTNDDLFLKVPKNLPLLLKQRAEELQGQTLQIAKNQNGEYVHYSYDSVYESVLKIAYALKRIGVKEDSKIGFVSDNRSEWLVLDYAILSLAAIDVPRGMDASVQEIQFILNYCECEFCIFENFSKMEKVLAYNSSTKFDSNSTSAGEPVQDLSQSKSCIKTVILIDSPSSEKIYEFEKAKGIRLYTYSDLEKISEQALNKDLKEIESGMEKITGENIATIIFTSGTTGSPKGVMLTHDNYVAQCEAVKKALPTTKDGDIWLSVLPVWHSFERVFQYFIPALKSSIAYSKPVGQTLLQDMASIHPTWMCGVPRLWESLANGIFRKMKKEKFVKRTIFSFSIKVGKAFSRANDRLFGLVCRYNNFPRVLHSLLAFLPYIFLFPLNALCKKLVFNKLHALFGGKMCAAISGGGALQGEIDSFYKAIGFTLLEGYGITEAGPVLSVRSPLCPRSGCVGTAFPAAEIRIVALAEDGSLGKTALLPGQKGIIEARGRQIMKGYYKRDDLTSKVISSEGYLNTGDIGMMSYDGEVKITGRAKDTIVLLAGENIEPATIEAALMNSPYIERAMVVGQDKKYVAALIVPEKEPLIELADSLKITYSSWEALLKARETQSIFQKEVDKLVCIRTGFRACERIGKFYLLPTQFEMGKEINAKGEMMRHKINVLYKNEISSLFV